MSKKKNSLSWQVSRLKTYFGQNQDACQTCSEPLENKVGRKRCRLCNGTFCKQHSSKKNSKLICNDCRYKELKDQMRQEFIEDIQRIKLSTTQCKTQIRSLEQDISQSKTQHDILKSKLQTQEDEHNYQIGELKTQIYEEKVRYEKIQEGETKCQRLIEDTERQQKLALDKRVKYGGYQELKYQEMNNLKARQFELQDKLRGLNKQNNSVISCYILCNNLCDECQYRIIGNASSIKRSQLRRSRLDEKPRQGGCNCVVI